jgi:hypothetical protein
MGSAVESVDLYCLAEVLDWLPSCGPQKGVELVDLQRLVEEAGRPGFQRSAEEAELAGFAMVDGNWTLQSPRCIPKGVLD